MAAASVIRSLPLELFPPVSPFNLFTGVKWEQLFLYMFQLHVMEETAPLGCEKA